MPRDSNILAIDTQDSEHLYMDSLALALRLRPRRINQELSTHLLEFFPHISSFAGYDLVILGDVFEGVEDLEMIMRLRRGNTTSEIHVLSSNPEEEMRGVILGSGADDYKKKDYYNISRIICNHIW